MKKSLLSLIILFCSFFVFSQKILDVRFVKYLADTESYKECIFEINRAADITSYRQHLRDSLLYYKAWSQYSLKLLDSSSETFLEISNSSFFYSQARLFATYNLIHIGKYKKAIELCDELSKSPEIHSSLVNFEAAGCSLLKRNYVDFERYMTKVDTSRYYLKAQSSLLYSFSKDLKEHKKKSPFIAAGLSSILPGLGKIYAGKTGEGISSLLTVGGLGLVTWEQYRKNGINDYKTIIAGTITSLFYLANIYGSYFSVVLTEKEFHNAYKNKILFNIHIPLRTFYK